MSQTTVQRSGVPGGKWWLPVLLVLIIAAIVGGAYAATHRGSSHKATPTPTATSAPPTATGTPVPTATAVKGAAPPTATPKPSPTAAATSTPAATPTPTLTTGTISLPPDSQLQTIQQGANSGNTSYTYYLNPFQVVQRNLPRYGFTTVTIVSPTPQPSPTPYTGNSGLPEVQITVQYQGKRYLIVLDQPKQQGAKGIWEIVRIKPL
ncbi:MAG TPA: hypothetical protein VKX16_14850 [Chloroflexota bacterium]|nr:hypothetical protein [Chloroflexota bacterium]